MLQSLCQCAGLLIAPQRCADTSTVGHQGRVYLVVDPLSVWHHSATDWGPVGVVTLCMFLLWRSEILWASEIFYIGGPAVSVMAMSLDSHVVDCGSHPRPGGLKLMPGACACVPKIPRGEWKRRNCCMAIPHGERG